MTYASPKGATPKREVLPDPKYGSRVVTKFVNQMMYDGKKSVAESIFYDAIEELENAPTASRSRAFEQLIEKVKPQMEVKSVVSVALPTRFPWKSAPQDGSLGYPLAGQLCVLVARKAWFCVWRLNFWMLITIAVVPSRSVKTPIEWLKPTKLSHITAGKEVLLCLNVFP